MQPKRMRVWAPNYEQTDLTNFCFTTSDGKLWCCMTEVARRSPYFATVFAQQEVPVPYEFDVCKEVPDTTVAEFKVFLDAMFGERLPPVQPKFYKLAALFELRAVMNVFEQHALDYDEKTKVYPNLDAYAQCCISETSLKLVATQLLKVKRSDAFLHKFNGTPLMLAIIDVLNTPYVAPTVSAPPTFSFGPVPPLTYF